MARPVLRHAAMKMVLLAALGAVAVSTLAPGSAAAGGYAGLALGTEPAVSDAWRQLATPTGRSPRVMGGARFGRWSVEGALAGFNTLSSFGEHTMYQLSAAGRYNHPLGDDFEVFGRLGVERTWLGFGDERYDFAGTGFLIGAGAAYRLPFAGRRASVFVDYTLHNVTLANTRAESSETFRGWSLGFLVHF